MVIAFSPIEATVALQTVLQPPLSRARAVQKLYGPRRRFTPPGWRRKRGKKVLTPSAVDLSPRTAGIMLSRYFSECNFDFFVFGRRLMHPLVIHVDVRSSHGVSFFPAAWEKRPSLS